MPWFAAHVIMSVRFKDGRQDKYPVWENIILIEAPTDKEAWCKAEARAKEDEGDSRGTFTWDGRAATWVFAGIRKLIICDQLGAPPESGLEITYSELELRTPEDLQKLVEGQPVTVTYVE